MEAGPAAREGGDRQGRRFDPLEAWSCGEREIVLVEKWPAAANNVSRKTHSMPNGAAAEFVGALWPAGQSVGTIRD